MGSSTSIQSSSNRALKEWVGIVDAIGLKELVMGR